MKVERIIYILVIIVLVVIIIFQKNKNINHYYIETTTDTLYITDSIIINKPHYINKYITHHTVDTLYTTDSILVPVTIPIETAIYSDSTDTYRYKATISGYKPSLDELNIYTTTPSYNTIQTKYKPYKWSISIGASYQPFNKTVHPSINIGYNIFSW